MSPVINPVENHKFGSFAVLDFETSNLPEYRCYKVGLTELSIYGIALSEFNSVKENVDKNPPALPRVLHKLTLMINPMMAIDPGAEHVSGLNNFLLEAESTFDENAGNLLLSFLNHLQKPVCLVAHNGYTFDFPILKSVLERKGMSIPDSIYALDSLRAFHDIDKTLESINGEINSTKVVLENKEEINSISEAETVIKCEEQNFDAQSQNETTPKRPIKRDVDSIARKRKQITVEDDDELDNENKTPKAPSSRRRLNFGETPTSSTSKICRKPGKKWYPPKNLYKLPNLFKRVFKVDPVVAHHAEADVKTLTQLMLHYGLYFVDYAEEHAIPFSKIPRLGGSSYI